MATNVFADKASAETAADAANAAPLGEGKEKRTTFKVYEVRNGEKTVFAVAQTPQPALYAAAVSIGVSIDIAGSARPVLPMNEYFARLSPEQLAEARKYLGTV